MIDETSWKPIIRNMTTNGAAEMILQGMKPQADGNVTPQLKANDS